MSLSLELQPNAIPETNEDPKRVAADILAIKEWLKKQPHLHCRQDDQWILNFLRGSKFSLERTKEKIDTHLTLKTLLPEFVTNRDPERPEIRDFLRIGNLVHLKNPDAHGRAILLHRVGLFNPKNHDPVDLIKYGFLNFDLIFLENVRSCIYGLTVVVDLKGITSDLVFNMNLTNVKKSVTYQTAYPFPSQTVYCINAPSAFQSAYGIMSSFTDTYKFYGNDLTEFYKDVPKSVLPKEYGGDAGPIDELIAEWNEKILSHRDWLIEDEKYGSDEKKRRGRAITASDMFGMEGSFRTLNFD